MDLSEPLLGLASLPRERLAKLAVLLGLLAIASPLRRLLDRQQVEQYRRVLGEEAWQFVRQRSSFLISGVPLIEDLPEPHILLDHSSTVGYCWLYPVLAETPRALFVRASLKMPAAIESSWQQASPPPNLATVLRVYREAEPDWQRLFAGAG